MREVIIQLILQRFKEGYDEVIYPFSVNTSEKNLRKILESLSDQELADAFDRQCCQDVQVTVSRDSKIK